MTRIRFKYVRGIEFEAREYWETPIRLSKPVV